MPTRPAALRFRDPTYAAKLGDQFAGGMVAPIGGVFEAENIPLIERAMSQIRQASKTEDFPAADMNKLLGFEDAPVFKENLREMLEGYYRTLGGYLKQTHGMTPEQIASEDFKFKYPIVNQGKKVTFAPEGRMDQRTIQGVLGAMMDHVEFLLDKVREVRGK